MGVLLRVAAAPSVRSRIGRCAGFCGWLICLFCRLVGRGGLLACIRRRRCGRDLVFGPNRAQHNRFGLHLLLQAIRLARRLGRQPQRGQPMLLPGQKQQVGHDDQRQYPP